MSAKHTNERVLGMTSGLKKYIKVVTDKGGRESYRNI